MEIVSSRNIKCCINILKCGTDLLIIALDILSCHPWHLKPSSVEHRPRNSTRKTTLHPTQFHYYFSLLVVHRWTSARCRTVALLIENWNENHQFWLKFGSFKFERLLHFLNSTNHVDRPKPVKFSKWKNCWILDASYEA